MNKPEYDINGKPMFNAKYPIDTQVKKDIKHLLDTSLIEKMHKLATLMCSPLASKSHKSIFDIGYTNHPVNNINIEQIHHDELDISFSKSNCGWHHRGYTHDEILYTKETDTHDSLDMYIITITSTNLDFTANTIVPWHFSNTISHDDLPSIDKNSEATTMTINIAVDNQDYYIDNIIPHPSSNISMFASADTQSKYVNAKYAQLCDFDTYFDIIEHKAIDKIFKSLGMANLSLSLNTITESTDYLNYLFNTYIQTPLAKLDSIHLQMWLALKGLNEILLWEIMQPAFSADIDNTDVDFVLYHGDIEVRFSYRDVGDDDNPFDPDFDDMLYDMDIYFIDTRTNSIFFVINYDSQNLIAWQGDPNLKPEDALNYPNGIFPHDMMTGYKHNFHVRYLNLNNNTPLAQLELANSILRMIPKIEQSARMEFAERIPFE